MMNCCVAVNVNPSIGFAAAFLSDRSFYELTIYAIGHAIESEWEITDVRNTKAAFVLLHSSQSNYHPR